MKSMLITLVAMENDEPIAECSAEVDLETFEINDVEDQLFVTAEEDTYNGFAFSLEDKIYPVSVDFVSGANEFMVMDSDAIDALKSFVKDHPEFVEGEDDLLTDVDEEIEE